MFARAGKGVGNLFKPRLAQAPPQLPEPDHSSTYGFVYANDIAAPEIKKTAPRFPVGSIIVRERFDSARALEPTVVIAMIKRERKFSRTTGDWEFVTLNGSDLKLISRQTKGNCAECHTKAQQTDWVFIDQLKR